MNVSQTTSSGIFSAAPSPLFSCRSSSSETGDFAVIPPTHPSRTFVLCFHSSDGLGDKYDTRNSNVNSFFNLLDRPDSDQQECLDILPKECRKTHLPFFFDDDRFNTLLDKDTAIDIDNDIVEAYEYLMENCQSDQEGDKIALFGFSRGAYTARAVAEMIHKIGLLPKSAENELRNPSARAFSLYVRDVDDDWHKSFAALKKLNPRRICIDFVGVWDTVSSVGDVLPMTLPFSRCNTSIRVFRQALALNEPRARLHPKFYEFDAQGGQDSTDVQEVWFAGSHCDIGGCAAPADAPHSLGNIPLRWMVRECFRANTGIQFRVERLRDIGLDSTSLYPVVQERPHPLQPRCYHFNAIAPRVPMASEEEHDVRDALSPMHDQFFVYAPLWWLLDLIPIWRRVPLGPLPAEWRQGQKTVRINLPRGLVIPKDRSNRFYVHPTVYTRMQAEQLREEPF